jgi:hypothetical protein
LYAVSEPDPMRLRTASSLPERVRLGVPGIPVQRIRILSPRPTGIEPPDLSTVRIAAERPYQLPDVPAAEGTDPVRRELKLDPIPSQHGTYRPGMMDSEPTIQEPEGTELDLRRSPIVTAAELRECSPHNLIGNRARRDLRPENQLVT